MVYITKRFFLRAIRAFVVKWLQKHGFLYMYSVDKYIYLPIDIMIEIDLSIRFTRLVVSLFALPSNVFYYCINILWLDV